MNETGTSNCCGASIREWVGGRLICNNCGKECYTAHPTEEWEAEFDKMWKQNGLHLGYKNTKHEPVKSFIRSLIEKAERRGREAGISEAVALSDRIEMENPTEFNEWRAFKGFRNALRDLLTPPQGS